MADDLTTGGTVLPITRWGTPVMHAPTRAVTDFDDDLRTLVTFFKSPASAKYQALGADATNAWAKKIVDATRTSVEGSASTFDAAAAKIVSNETEPNST